MKNDTCLFGGCCFFVGCLDFGKLDRLLAFVVSRSWFYVPVGEEKRVVWSCRGFLRAFGARKKGGDGHVEEVYVTLAQGKRKVRSRRGFLRDFGAEKKGGKVA